MAPSPRSDSSRGRPRGSGTSGPGLPSNAATWSPRPSATRQASTTSSTASATTCCRSRSTSPTRPRSTPPSSSRTTGSAGAGYGLFGTVEEVTEEQARAQIPANLFGALWVTKAALPYLREQGSGHIIQVSSIGGVNAFPTLGLYHASKWGLEGFSQSLAAEVKGFGVNVTLVEPTAYSTDWAGPSSVQAEQLAAYEHMRDAAEAQRAQRNALRGDSEATDPAIVELVDAEGPPVRIFFGRGPARYHPQRVREPHRDLGTVERSVRAGARRRRSDNIRCCFTR